MYLDIFYVLFFIVYCVYMSLSLEIIRQYNFKLESKLAMLEQEVLFLKENIKAQNFKKVNCWADTYGKG